MFQKPLRPAAALPRTKPSSSRISSSMEAAVRERRTLAAATAVASDPSKRVLEFKERLAERRIDRLAGK